MKDIFAFTFNPYLFYVKTRVNDENVIKVRSDTDFISTLKNMELKRDDKSIKFRNNHIIRY
jgi:hypothetical protein